MGLKMLGLDVGPMSGEIDYTGDVGLWCILNHDIN